MIILWFGAALVLIGLWFQLCESEPDAAWLFIGLGAFTWWIQGMIIWAGHLKEATGS